MNQSLILEIHIKKLGGLILCLFVSNKNYFCTFKWKTIHPQINHLDGTISEYSFGKQHLSVLSDAISLQETNSVRALVHHTTHSSGTRCSKTRQVVLSSNVSLEDGLQTLVLYSKTEDKEADISRGGGDMKYLLSVIFRFSFLCSSSRSQVL